jgi:long-chain fatty acid transport protein
MAVYSNPNMYFMKKVLFNLLILSFPAIVTAQGFQINLQGQKQQAMGGAASALAQDGASLFYNPGAVSFLKENSVSLGTSTVMASSRYTDAPSGNVSKTESPVGFPFAGYAVLGKQHEKLKYGLAVYTPFGSVIKWEDAWTGRFVITELKLQTIFIQPTISYKISEKIGIGAGFVYGLGTLDLQSDLPIFMGDGKFSSMQLHGKGHGYGFNAGIYYEPVKKLSFGLTYRSQVNLNFKDGQATYTVPPSMEADFPSGNVSTKMPLPGTLSLATAYKPSEKFTTAFEMTMVGWKSYDTLSYDFENNTYAVSDMKLARNYKNTFSYRVGAEYKLSDKVAARAGLKYLATPVKEGFVTPEVPDANHFSYSAGLGYKLNNKLSADLSFTYERIKRTDNNQQVQLNGSYVTQLLIPGLSLNYAF